MKLIIGLGNPGLIYAGSRHNIGFSVVKALCKLQRPILSDELAPRLLRGKKVFKREPGCLALTAKLNSNIMLAMPLTFMNLSGSAVGCLLRKYKIDLQDLLVICDDLDLELGRIKLRCSGSSGGQRGLKSIIGVLGVENFSRLRIGIGRPKQHIDAAEYVLEHFSRAEKKELKEAVGKAIDCCLAWIDEGIVKTMNNYNKKEPSK